MLQLRLIYVFTAASNISMREEVLKEFCKTDTKLGVLIATTAFGLGVDCIDIERVINYGTPSTLEELVQESGQAGRDGREASSILYHKTVKRITPAAKMYSENQSFAAEHFYLRASPKACKCCDLCMLSCNCSICRDFKLLYYHNLINFKSVNTYQKLLWIFVHIIIVYLFYNPTFHFFPINR